MPLTPGEDTGHWPELHRERRALVVVDVVESVRLMQQHEDDFIARWRRFVNEVRSEVLPPHGGRLVKSLGDGMLLEFGEVRNAVAAAHELHGRATLLNATSSDTAAIRLRVGAHIAEVVIDDLDVYGSGVNLAARLATLAGPGQTVISVEAREQVVPELDGNVSDLGDCYLKHIHAPVRAYRIDPPTHLPHDGLHLGPATQLRPVLAIVPWQTRSADPRVRELAKVLTDDLTAAAAQSHCWTTISRLTLRLLSDRPLDIASLGGLLHADYVLSGELRTSGGDCRVRLEMADVRTQCVVWIHQSRIDEEAAFDPATRLTATWLREATAAVLSHEVSLNHAAALPNLPGYSLYLHAVTLLHRLSRIDVARARDVLEELVERHPRSPDARAWLGKWHFMQLAQATSADRGNDLARARAHLRRALQTTPDHALSLALDGHLCAFADGDPGAAEAQLRVAVDRGASEPLVWLFLSNVLVQTGRAAEAVRAIERARQLSPWDPMRYFFDTFASSAYSAAGMHEQALAAANNSLRQNAAHLPGLVQLIIAQVLAEKIDDARATARRYLELRPQASVSRFLKQHGARGLPQAQLEASALLEAGLPP